jgi:putative tryptophan/tyrosine transport system substrate-binding protein
MSARAIGLQIHVLNASTSREIEAAFATIARERPEAFFVGNAPFLNARRVQLVQLMARQTLRSVVKLQSPLPNFI